MIKTPSQKSLNQNPSAISKLDEQFIKIMLEVEKHYGSFNKHEKIRIEQWSKKLCQVTINPTWKQNRNLYALLLLDAILKGTLTDPFHKIPPEGSLVGLNKHIVKTRIGSLEERIEDNIIEDAPQRDSTPTKTPINVQRSRKNSIKESPTTEKRSSFKENNYGLIKPNYSSRASTAKNKSNSGMIDMSNQEIKNPDTLNSARSSDFNSVKIVQGRASADNQSISSKKRSDSKEYFKMKAEVDLAKLNEESLKNEINMKNLTISQLNKKLEIQSNEVANLIDQKEALLNFFKIFKQNYESGMFKFNSTNSNLAIVREFNEVSPKFFISPLNLMTSEINPPSTLKKLVANIDNTFQVHSNNVSNSNINYFSNNPSNAIFNSNQQNNYFTGASGKSSNILNLSQSNSNNLSQNGRPTNEDHSIEDLENYIHKLSENKHKSNTKQKEVQRSSVKPTKKEDLKDKIGKSDKDTLEFLNYLDKFQQENDKLKKETEKLLIRSSQYQKDISIN